MQDLAPFPLNPRPFRALCLWTIGAVYFLILVGGIVRASGSGMGCPDWPKCFGRWIPPTAESELPADYQERYAERGYRDQPFNAVKTWTEYLNRLVGVAIGFLILLTMLASLRYWSTDRVVVGCSVAAFVLVAFQGWLGSVVVSTNLHPVIVTVHMMLALVIVGVLVYAAVRAERKSAAFEAAFEAVRASRRVRGLLIAAVLVSAVQIVLGTQIRERVDEAALAVAERSEWVAEVGTPLLVHRTLSLIVLALNLALWAGLRRASARGGLLDLLGNSLLTILVLEIAAGAVLYYFALPAVLQPVHLLLAAILAGIQLAIWTWYRAGSTATTAATSRSIGRI